MKKIRLFLLFICSLFIGILSVDAMTLKPSGDTNAVRGENITIYISLNRTEQEKTVSAIDGKFTFDGNVFSLVSADSVMGNNWTQLSVVNNNSTFSYANLTFNDLISSTSKNIVKVILKVNNNAKNGTTVISVSNPTATDQNGDGVSIYGGNHTVKILSDENELSNLTVSGGTINFSPTTTNYDLTIDSNSIEIGATVKDNSSKLSGDIGTKSLKYGSNVFKITVTSESGKNRVYVLNITRPDYRSGVNTLSSLKLSAGKINFKSNILNYDINVENNISTIKLDAVLTDKKSSFVSGYGSRNVTLKEGKNTILIKVKAENENIRTYTINVVRKSNKSSNNYLSDIKLSSGIINFDKNKFDYSVNVNYDVKKINLEVKTEDDKATYEILGNNELSVGENVIVIKVKAEDESIREYKIVVIRLEENQNLSNDNKLSSLTIDNYDLKFDSDVYEYSLKIKDEDSLNINYTTSNSNSRVVISGNNDLKDGSVINILVTSGVGNDTLYKINIEKVNNIWLIIIIVSIILLLAGIVLFIIFNKKNKKNIVDNQNNDIENNYNDDSAIKNEFLNDSMFNNQNSNDLYNNTNSYYNTNNYDSVNNNQFINNDNSNIIYGNQNIHNDFNNVSNSISDDDINLNDNNFSVTYNNQNINDNTSNNLYNNTNNSYDNVNNNSNLNFAFDNINNQQIINNNLNNNNINDNNSSITYNNNQNTNNNLDSNGNNNLNNNI